MLIGANAFRPAKPEEELAGVEVVKAGGEGAVYPEYKGNVRPMP